MSRLVDAWSSEASQLLSVVVGSLAAIAMSYDYVASQGLLDVYFGIIGAGVLLFLLTVPAVFADRI
jgi:hypothetical protein